MERHFTGTVYILEEDRVLLHFHHKLNVWLPFGGHVEQGETPSEAAIREAKEECGLDVELQSVENVWIEQPNAQSIPRPFLCLLENVPPYKEEKAHQHIDCIYLGRATRGTLFDNPLIEWFTLEDLDELEVGKDLFAETKQVLEAIFAKEKMPV